MKQIIYKLLPNSARPLLRAIYKKVMSVKFIKNILVRKSSVEECHEYWINPPVHDNPLNGYYNKGNEISAFVYRLISKYATNNDRILEIGCNVGRNLDLLYNNGFTKLSGIEICPSAIGLMRIIFPDTAENSELHNVAIEDIIKSIPDDKYDILFTVACLEHIHPDSEWIFGEMARITKGCIVTIEDELAVSWKVFARNYKDVFESCGMKQVEELSCNGIKDLAGSYMARIFIRN